MSDEQTKEPMEQDVEEMELSDELLDAVAGGFIYHDEGDPTAHRRGAYYVVDADGNIIMRRDTLTSADHWADNLRLSDKMLTSEEFEKLRRKNKTC